MRAGERAFQARFVVNVAGHHLRAAPRPAMPIVGARVTSAEYVYYDPIDTLPEAGQAWWARPGRP